MPYKQLFIVLVSVLLSCLAIQASATEYKNELLQAKQLSLQGEIAKSLYQSRNIIGRLNADNNITQVLRDFYLIDAYNIAGIAYYKLQNYSQSFYYHQLALGLAKKNNFSRKLAETYRLSSIVFYKERDFVKAQEYLLRALPINLKYGVKDEIIKNYNNIGLIYFDRKDYKRALFYMNKAMSYMDKNMQFDKSIVLTNISQTYYLQGCYSTSLKILRQAMQLQQHYPFRPDMLQTQLNAIMSMVKVGRKVEAQTLIRSVDRRLRHVDVPELKSNSLQYLADICFQLNDSLQGLRYILQYYSLSDSIKNSSEGDNIKQLIKVVDMERLQQNNLQLAQSLKIMTLKDQKRKLLLIGGLLVAVVVTALLLFILRQSERLRKYEKEEFKNQELTMTEEIDYRNRQLTSATMEQASVNTLHTKILENVKQLQEEMNNPPAIVAEIINDIKQDISHYNNQLLGQDFRTYFDQVHPNFLSGLLQAYPQLSKNDLHICAYIHLGLSTKEIAALTFRETKSVDSARNRLRKKLNLPLEVSIQSFLNDFNANRPMR